MKKIIVVLFLGLMLFSCGSRRSTVHKNKAKNSRTERVVIDNTSKDTQATKDIETTSKVSVKISSTEQYLAVFSPIAKEEMRLYGIPASITLAQGILESNSGRGRLSVEANNHFGIKCHDWTGAKVYHDDDKRNECFRKYRDAKYSYRDHSLFLSTRGRYSNLFDLDKDDYKRWAKGLKAAGYATDKKYPDKLISLIERYELYKYDDEVLDRKRRRRNRTEDEVVTTNKNEIKDSVAMADRTLSNEKVQGSNVVKETVQVSKELSGTLAEEKGVFIVGEGDTLYSISKKYGLTVEELQTLNSLTSTDLSIGQELKVKAKIERNIYIVEQGDTLYSISKKYNTTVQTLQQLNGLTDIDISVGQKLLVK